VHSVVRELQQDEVRSLLIRSVDSIANLTVYLKDMEPFQFVEINGMKIAEPNTSFTILWEALSGEKAAPRSALAQLESHFQTPEPSRKTTFVALSPLEYFDAPVLRCF